MASRLSYFLLNSMPDDQLFAAAEAGELETPEQIGKQATRLMGDARFRETLELLPRPVAGAGAAALSAEKDADAVPGLERGAEDRPGGADRRFIQGVMREGDGKVETLLTASFSFLSGPLYDLYGLTQPAGAAANTWAKVDLDPKQRAGLLTHAG